MKVLITRPRAQSTEFGNALQRAGFEPVYFPVIEIRPAEYLSALDDALANIGQYAWVVFTSVNGVDVVFERSSPSPLRPSPFGRGDGSKETKIAAVGAKTAEALRVRGVGPDFIPGEFTGEAILPGLGDLRGKWVLLPRAEIARKALPEAIVAAGGVAHEITVYHTLPAQPDPEGLAALKTGVDWITFTSPSTVENFVEIVRRAGLDPLHLPGNPKIACIGPITQKTAEEAGFVDLVVADEYTTEGLVKLLLNA